ncbi:hypothetical protein [Halofilum ochraceum]|uniref:hypothetical protein n=1 Tax=Halofilum ochraceum TaxID=1611323 RepID=UPI0008DA0EA5|nr:hypothetical protein [Halofilum ochraceum]
MDREKPQIATSDDLPHLRSLFEENGPLSAYGDSCQFDLIFDANALLRDIYWLSVKANDKDTRTSVLEALESEVIQGYAPSYLRTEIAEKIQEMSLRYDIPERVFLNQWARFEGHIHFVEVGGPDEGGSDDDDPKDVPYIRLHEMLDYPVVSRDTDIRRMGGRSVDPDICFTIRLYARDNAVELQLVSMAAYSTMIPAAVVSGLTNFFRQMIVPRARSTPTWAWIAIVMIIGIAFIHPQSRKYLQDTSERLIEGISPLLGVAHTLLTPLIDEYGRATLSSAETRRAIEDSLQTG